MIYHSSKHRDVLSYILNTRIRSTDRPLARRCTVIWDLYDIEDGVPQKQLTRVQQHLAVHDVCGVIINLSHENISNTAHGLQQYVNFIRLWNPQQVTVWSSQADALQHLQDTVPGIRTQEINFWEYATRTHRGKLRRPREPRRLVSLNRRYHPLRSQLIHQLWPYRQQLHYTLGATDPWGHIISDEEYHAQEWRGMPPGVQHTVEQWEAHAQPWRSLDCDISDWEQTHTWNFTNQGDVCIVMESRHQSRVPRTHAFVTEKTFRPIAMGKPILVFGQPSIINTLNTWGYQTINTSADFNTVAHTAQQIATMPDDEYAHKLKYWKQVAQANLKRFNSRTEPLKPLAAAR